METLHEEPGNGKPVPTRLSLDDITIDWEIYPRAKFDDFTEEKYFNDLINGVSFPYPKVEQIGEGIYRITDGVYTVKGYKYRRDLYRLRDAGEYIGDPLPEISDEELNTVLCVIETVPADVDPMLYCARHNMKHGKALTSEDYRKLARHLYSKWFGVAVTKLATELGIKWETVKGYIADMVEDYEKQREELILRLDAEGKTQEEIGRLGREEYPHGPGWCQETISKFLAEHRKSATPGRKNGSRKVLNFRGSYEKQKKEKEGLDTIECPDSFMVTGLSQLHEEICETYLRALKNLVAITWAKELRLRERLGNAPH